MRASTSSEFCVSMFLSHTLSKQASSPAIAMMLLRSPPIRSIWRLRTRLLSLKALSSATSSSSLSSPSSCPTSSSSFSSFPRASSSSASSFSSFSRTFSSSCSSCSSSWLSRWESIVHGCGNRFSHNDAPGTLNFRREYSAFASGYSALTRKTLDSILKLESVKDSSAEELTTIWNEYHIGRGHISAVMGSQLFNLLQQRASACPLFVIPVRRGLGYVTLLLQAQMPYLLFTGLDDYRARGSDATPYLTVTHYTEFSETKDLVLVRGDVVLTSKLSDKEARAALEAAHSFYLNTSRYRLVTTFNKDSQDFEFRDVLRELNMSA